jgi:SH3-like domain-containing protein
MRTGKRAQLAAAALMSLGALMLSGAAGQAASNDRPTPSGLPVPRYVSLKFDKVNARAGPGDDHRLLWVYKVRGLPLQVIAETSEWRRVCDPDGELAWVHKRTTDGRRTALNTNPQPAPLRAQPQETARVVAYLKPRALAAVVRCDKGWCRVKVDDAAGWVQDGELWGTADAPQCPPRQAEGSPGALSRPSGS